MTLTPPDSYQSGYVALIGRPNVGKSTLMNALVGQKLSIVSRKPQTTRHQVLGILSGEAYQIIFLDTPGLVKPRYGLHQSMMRTVDRALHDADVLLFMVDATKTREDPLALSRIGERPALLVINKMDLIDHKQALPLVEYYISQRTFEAVLPISAHTGYQLDVLKKELLARIPQGPPYYPPDMVSEHPERFFVAEMIREKVFQQYRDEIPYATQVNIVAYEERPNEKDLIDAEIVVERNTQKGILIGKQGQALKRLGTSARMDIEAWLGRPVFLRLFVKVRPDWRNRPTFLKSFGYDP